MIPRRNEVTAVTDLLQSESFDSPEAMAKAIVKAVADELGKRKTFGVAAGFEERPLLAYGPFYSEADAKRYATRLAASGLDTRVAGLLGPDAYVMDAEPTKKSNKCACGHLAHMHGVWRKGTLDPGPGGCAWKGCRCGAMTAGEAA